MFNANDFEFLNRWSAVYSRVLPRIISDKAVKQHTNAGRVVVQLAPTLNMLFVINVTDIVQPEDGIASIPVTQDFLKTWKVSPKNLYQAAMKNLRNTWDESCIKKLDDVLCLPSLPFSVGMVVITNRDMMNGAAVALQARRAIKNVLGTEDVYVLPSSVHEMLAVRKEDCPDVQDLYDMVRSINESDVITENDYLATDVYQYDRDGRLVSAIHHDTETVNIEYQYEKVKAVAYAD